MEAPQAGWMCAKAGEMKNSRKKRLLLWAGGAVLFFGVLCFGLIQYRVYSLSAPYRVAEEEAPEAQAIAQAELDNPGSSSRAFSPMLRAFQESLRQRRRFQLGRRYQYRHRRFHGR